MYEAIDYHGILSGRSWWYGNFDPKPVFLTYSFETAPYDYLQAKGYSRAFGQSFRPFDAGEKAAARDALKQWDDASGIVFLEAPAGQGDIRFGNYDFNRSAAHADAAAFAYFPDTTMGGLFDTYESEDSGGDVFVNTSSMGYSASDMTHLLAHEIGHAIGMKHPFDGYPILDPKYDSDAYTVMSYTGLSPKLGPFDIAAAQAVYGTDAQDGSALSSWSWNAGRATLTQTGRGGGDLIRGVAANDVINGMSGSDRLFGSGGRDGIDGGAHNDLVFGGEDDDRVGGGGGNDTVHGDAGDDTVTGGAGKDRLYGDDGTDTLDGGSGDDALSGGAGLDTADYGAAGKAVTVSLEGIVAHGRYANATGIEVGRDSFYGIENANGGSGNDTLSGDFGANVLQGNRGSDTIDGGGGADWLYGGTGRDDLTGGNGADRFVFDAKYGGANLKAITDFKPGTDKLVLDEDTFHGVKSAKNGTLLAANLYAGDAAHDATDRIVYDKDTGALFYDPDGIGGRGQTKIATLDAGLSLHGADFLIVA